MNAASAEREAEIRFGGCGFGCALDMLGFALPALCLLLSIGVFVVVWVLKGDTHRAGFGAAGIAFYGGVTMMFAYLPYGVGYTASRLACRLSSPRLVFTVAALLLTGSLALGGVLLFVGAFPAAVTLAFFVSVPALGAGVSTLVKLQQIRWDRAGGFWTSSVLR